MDKDDYAAFQHDINYDSLVAQAREYGISEKQFHKTLEEIDHKTIGEFYREFKATGSWHSLLGHVGLRLKGLAERVANRPLYPRQPLRRLGEYKIINNATTKKARAHAATVDPTWLDRIKLVE